MLSKVQFKHKIIFGFLVPITVLVASMLHTAYNISNIKKMSMEIKNTDLILARTADNLKFDAAEVQQWLTDVSATRAAPGYDDGFKKADEYAVDMRKNLEVFADYYKKVNDEPNMKRVETLKVKFESFYDVGKKMANEYIKGGPAAGNAYMGNFDKVAEELDKEFTPFITEHIDTMNKAIDKNDQSVATTMFVLRAALVVAALICSFVLFFLYKAITTINFQFSEIGRFAGLLRDGDLAAKVNIDTHDEVGRLAESFNSTMAFIRDAFKTEKIEWSEIASQKQREIEAQVKTQEALKSAEKEKAEAMESKKLADVEKSKAEEAMVMASDEKRRAEELALNEKKSAEELRLKVDNILNVVKAAEAGDLTQKIQVEGSDAIGQLAGALDSFFNQLSHDLVNIDGYAKDLEKQSLSLSNKSDVLGKNANEASHLSLQMSDQTDKVILNIKNLSHSTGEMKQAVSEISRQATETTKFSNNAVTYVTDAKQVGAKLEESSNDIAQFISVITAIARQTNLLALNATIEAARAGEAGKGFAVVANEVKELARQSAQAADEITNKVMTIKSNSQELSKSILKVNELMESINSASRVVASATEEQFATTDQFAELIGYSVKEADLIGVGSKKVNDSSLYSNTIVKENIELSKELGATSEKLNLMVKKFTLKGVADPKNKFKLAS